MDITGRGHDDCVYVLRGDGLVRAIYDEYHYLAAIAYGVDIVAISEIEAQEIMIKELENEGYFGGYLYGADFEDAETSDIYDLYLEKVC